MELVGIATEYREEDKQLWVEFCCTNKEKFSLKVSPAIERIPPDVTVRVWTTRPVDELGIPRRENVLVHWEEL